MPSPQWQRIIRLLDIDKSKLSYLIKTVPGSIEIIEIEIPPIEGFDLRRHYAEEVEEQLQAEGLGITG